MDLAFTTFGSKSGKGLLPGQKFLVEIFGKLTACHFWPNFSDNLIFPNISAY